MTRQSQTQPDVGTLGESLNRKVNGWANYFCLGPVSLAYRAVEQHTCRRLRQWLRVKLKSGSGQHAERKYDRALAAFTKAKELAPDFPLTYRKLGLPYEAMGDVKPSRANLTHYEELISDQAAKSEANLHLTTLDANKSQY